MMAKRWMKKLQIDGEFIHLLDLPWFLNGGYAARNGYAKDGKRRHVYMHRLIVGAKPGQQVDHINGDTLDNRKANLRICTHEINCQNQATPSKSQSGYRGVYRQGRKWIAEATASKKRVRLGPFDSVDEAVSVIREWRQKNMPGYVEHGF